MIKNIGSRSIQVSYSVLSSSRLDAPASKLKSANSATTDGVRFDNSKKEASAELTPQQLQQVEELKQIDRKVRQHEQAHLAVGRDLVISGPSYTYQTGPDKQRYAVAGEVSIDTSPGRSPEETVPKAQHIRATALAPVDPSAQDQSVATAAGRMESEARIELAAQKREQLSSSEQTSSRLYREAGQGDKVGGQLDFFA